MTTLAPNAVSRRTSLATLAGVTLAHAIALLGVSSLTTSPPPEEEPPPVVLKAVLLPPVSQAPPKALAPPPPVKSAPKPDPVQPPPGNTPVKAAPPPAPLKAEPKPTPLKAEPKPAPVEAASQPALAKADPAPPLPAAPARQPAAVEPANETSAADYKADYLSNPHPAYPRQSRRLGEEGRVLLRVLVSAEGRALQVELSNSSGYSRLDEAARAGVAHWRFKPARRAGRPVEGWVTVPINFTLKD